MQMFTTILCFLMLVVSSSVATFGQYDFFYSFNEFGTGVVNSNPGSCRMVGESGTMYIYYSTENSDLDTGGFLEVCTNRDGIIQFSAVETLEFEISVNGRPVGYRWEDAFGPGVISSDGQQASFNAFTIIGGQGIISANEGPDSIDAGYDAGADAFLFARIDFDVVGAGEVIINTQPGVGGIVHDGQTLDPSFGTVTILGVNLTPGCPLGDVNRDGIVDLRDVDPFIELLSEGLFQSEADINQDFALDLLDVGPFIDLLSGG